MRLFLAAVLVLVALSACGGGTGARSRAPTHKPGTLALYSSLPLSGPQARAGIAVERGIELDLHGSGVIAGDYRILYRSLNDAGTRRAWSATRTVANAARAATNPRTAYYIGELRGAANELSAPILASAGIPQLSPWGTPFRDSPPSFLSLLPTAAVQANALVAGLRTVGCTHMAIAWQRGRGTLLAALIRADARARRITISKSATVGLRDRSATAYALALRALALRNLAPNCFVYAGAGVKTASAVTRAVHAAVPHATLLGTAAVCGSAWDAAAPVLLCTSPRLPVSAYPGGKTFARAYERRFGGSHPSSYALYGYEAAQLLVDGVRALGSRAGDRAALMQAIIRSNPRSSVLGPFAFASGGETTIGYYGFYVVANGHAPRFYKTLVVS